MPKISVIMPAYNAEKYIGEAIDSILGQSWGDFELIILNECSKDGTENIILAYNDPRIVYVKNEENLGVARTLNKGLALAKGCYIARMDADDISLPHRFETQAAYLDSHPDCVVCGSWVERFGAVPGISEFPETDEKIKTAMLFANPIAHPSVMMRGDILRHNAMEYELAYEKVEDYRLWTRLAAFGRFYNFPMPLLRYRIHPEQVCATAAATQHEGRLRLAAGLLGAVGVTEAADVEAVVSAFDGTLSENDGWKRFLSLALVLAKNPNAPDRAHMKRMMKSQILELALKFKATLPVKCLPLVGIKAFLYVNLKGIWK